MKKEYFFFNSKILVNILLQKAIFNTFSIKFLIRFLGYKNKRFALLDTFSIFFLFKLFKKKIKKHFYNTFSAKKKVFQRKIFYSKKVGSFIVLDRKIYFNKNIFFIFYNQKIFLKKIKYLISFIETLKQVNFFDNYVTFLKKTKIKRGLIKYYSNGFIILEPIKKHLLYFYKLKKYQIKEQKELKKKKKLIQLPLIKGFKRLYIYNKNHSFLLGFKPMYFLIMKQKKIKNFHKKKNEIKMFSLRKKLYSKDFRYFFHLRIKK